MPLSPGGRVGDAGAEKEPHGLTRQLSTCTTMEAGEMVPRQLFAKDAPPPPFQCHGCLQCGYSVQRRPRHLSSLRSVGSPQSLHLTETSVASRHPQFHLQRVSPRSHFHASSDPPSQ